MTRTTLALVAATLIGCDAASTTGDLSEATPADFQGNWTGDWINETFDSTGSATMDVTVNEDDETASITLDLNGDVFGGADPAAVTLDGTWDDKGVYVSAETDLLGTFSLTWLLDGSVAGDATPALFDSLTIDGTGDTDTLALNYAIFDEPGSEFAVGTITLSK